MRKHFYSLLFKVTLGFFLSMLCTCAVIAVGIYLMMRFHRWVHFFTPGAISLLVYFAVISVLIGSCISLFVTRHILKPIRELSSAMQKVAQGDYTIALDGKPYKGELFCLYRDFNSMVKELSSTETLHSDFISNVSHEFKTPLSSISGYATLLQDDTLSPEERNEYTQIIIQSTKELSTMTGNILHLSHLENESIIHEKVFFRVDEQLRQAILRLEPVWSGKHLVINPELEKITWYGNMELTAHIWNNLLDNAIKFTPQGGEINITAHADNDWLTVVFQDSGIGMPPEVQAHIFDKFYQGDVSHKKKGNGLGLALVRKIVTLYGGSVQVESYPELGSTFTILLPMQSS